MAILRILIALAILVIVAQKTSAKDYIVGDEKGWMLKFNYTEWGLKTEFWVGDKLIFKYLVGAHNAIKVDGASFQQCVAPANTEVLKSGEDVITLATPGRKWYICGVAKHCEVGLMKLFVNVLSQVESPTPAPSSASGVTISKFNPLMVGVLVIVAMMIA